MHLIKHWNAAVGREEKLGVLGVHALDWLGVLASGVPYALAYTAGVEPFLAGGAGVGSAWSRSRRAQARGLRCSSWRMC